MKRDDADLTHEDEEARASLLSAASRARSAAMLTGSRGIVTAPLVRAAITLPSPASLLADASLAVPTEEDPLAALLAARTAGDPLGDASKQRAVLELAYTRLEIGDAVGARREATRAATLLTAPSAAHQLLLRLDAARDRSAAQLLHVEAAIAEASSDEVRASLLVERATLLEARDGPSEESAEAFARALALVPDHPGALAALETTLRATERFEHLAVHLGRLAGLAGDPELAAWHHVERAIVLERRLADRPAARAALERALELAPGLGLVRDACLDFATVHRDDAWLADLFESGARLETKPARIAVLELEAALAASAADAARAVALLEQAHGRAPTGRVVDRRVAEELVRLHESLGHDADVLRVRKAAVAFESDPREELAALRGVAMAAERASANDEAILALERARVLDAEDPTLLADLDRMLAKAGRHDARAVLWVREAARYEESDRKARALLVAAAAARAAGRDAEAARHLQTAWVSAPGDAGVFDAIAERTNFGVGREAVGARVALYEQAARSATDPRRRAHYLEKMAWLLDDVAGDASGAAAAYEDVLTLEPGRASAIAGLASAAARAGDARKLGRALLAEAESTAKSEDKARATLRAAEALAEVEPERALALAESLATSEAADVVRDGGAVLTAIHSRAGRWEQAARSLADRGARARGPERFTFALAEASIRLDHLSDPRGALNALAAAEEVDRSHPAVVAASVRAHLAIGDRSLLRAALVRFAEASPSLEQRARYFVRAAELAEDPEAIALYGRAQADEWTAFRLERLAARTPVPTRVGSPALQALRHLAGRPGAAPDAAVLAEVAPSGFATLRLVEALAREADAVPLLANALALQAESTTGSARLRALSGLARLERWSLPESDAIAPWDRLVELGSHDPMVLETLVDRVSRFSVEDRRATDLAREALRRRLEGAGDDTEKLVHLLALARASIKAGDDAEAIDHLRAALAVESRSVTAAFLLAELAARLGDRHAAVVAARAFAGVTEDPRVRAGLLSDAGDLSAASGDAKSAVAYFERALEADPENVMTAARLAQLASAIGAFRDLARALQRALSAAKTSEAIVPIASELAEVARTQLREPLVALEALGRAREVAPGHVPTLFSLAELFIGQRAWQKALDALGDVVTQSRDTDEKLTALVGRSSILGRVLSRPADAEVELRAALEIEPHDARALRGLLDVSVSLSLPERAALLSRLVIADPEPRARLGALLQLAEARRTLGDTSGAEGALVEACALSADPAMIERVRTTTAGDVEAFARVLARAIARGRESGRAPDATWLVEVGAAELALGRLDDATHHFEDALSVDPGREDARVLLGKVLASRGRHETAAAALAPLFDASARTPVDVPFFRLLETSFDGAGRTQQALVARELRALAGDLDAAALAELRARRAMNTASGEGLPPSSLRSFVMPGGIGDHPVWDVAQICRPLAGKIARIGLADRGASTRDRVKPRVLHPLRTAFDRLARLFEIVEIELAVADVSEPDVALEDVPWVIVPAHLATEPESAVIAALAPSFARITLGIPWRAALPAPEMIALLVGVARQVAPTFMVGSEARVEPFVAEYEHRARRAIDRRRRKMLEELEPALSAAPPLAEDTFVAAAARTEARSAFLASGDLVASLGACGVGDRDFASALRDGGTTALTAVFSRPTARDLVSFALSGDATALRRSLGTLSV